MMEDHVRQQCMRRAIELARLSKPEDERIHPRVGAVLTDTNGNVLETAFRGELAPGAHAEFCLFEKLKGSSKMASGATLFVTLEPCTRRSLEKIPCAVRVAESGVTSVHIGTLDPNPQIAGRGELFLGEQTSVERFPSELVRELRELNADFFGVHMHEHVPSVSPYAGGTASGFKPRLASQREGLLQQSMDLMTGSEGDLLIFAGGLSWLREMQVAFLAASLAGRSIRILRSPHEPESSFSQTDRCAQSLGASIAIATRPFTIRGTIASAGTDNASMISIERFPAFHGTLFQSPHDSGLLDAASHLFSLLSDGQPRIEAIRPELVSITEPQLTSILTRGVPAYATARMAFATVRPGDLTLLPRSLERFKLFRLAQLDDVRLHYQIPLAARIIGSPWPIVPPIVERRQGGQLVVIDGAHRVYSAETRGDQAIDVLLVSGVTAALPAKPQARKDLVKVGFERLPRSERYDDMRPEHFRPIRAAFQSFLEEVQRT